MKSLLVKIGISFLVLLVFATLYYLGVHSPEFKFMFKVIGILLGVLVIVVWNIKDNDPTFYDFLKLWVEFHIFGMHKEPKPQKFYQRLLHNHERLYVLEQTKPTGFEYKKMIWKKQLIEAIIEASGMFTVKMTGDKNHKARYKLKLHGNKYKLNGRAAKASN